MTTRRADALILFGITGDLAKKKLFPALYNLVCRGRLAAPVVGVGRTERSIDRLRAHARTSLDEAGMTVDEGIFGQLSSMLRYVSGDYQDSLTYKAIADLVGHSKLAVSYLAIPPSVFVDVIEGLASIGLNTTGRVVVEKPFGHDLDSAKALNQTLHDRYPESAVFRIDHFLGKEPVQNLMVFRFANKSGTGTTSIMSRSRWPSPSTSRAGAASTTTSAPLKTLFRTTYFKWSPYWQWNRPYPKSPTPCATNASRSYGPCVPSMASTWYEASMTATAMSPVSPPTPIPKHS